MSYLDHHYTIGPDRYDDHRRIIIFELAYEHTTEQQSTTQSSPRRISARGLYAKSLKELHEIATTQPAKDAFSSTSKSKCL